MGLSQNLDFVRSSGYFIGTEWKTSDEPRDRMPSQTHQAFNQKMGSNQQKLASMEI